MIRLLRSALGAAALILGAASAAWAIPGYVVTTVNLRAGPGTDYPIVDRLPPGAYVDIHGCIYDYDWCDVSAYGNRGWIRSDFLEASYHDRRVTIVVAAPPIITFSLFPYWQSYYPHRPWFHNWHRWERRHAHDRHDRHRDRARHHPRQDDAAVHHGPSRHRAVHERPRQHATSHHRRQSDTVQQLRHRPPKVRHHSQRTHAITRQRHQAAVHKQHRPRQHQCRREAKCR